MVVPCDRALPTRNLLREGLPLPGTGHRQAVLTKATPRVASHSPGLPPQPVRIPLHRQGPRWSQARPTQQRLRQRRTEIYRRRMILTKRRRIARRLGCLCEEGRSTSSRLPEVHQRRGDDGPVVLNRKEQTPRLACRRRMSSPVRIGHCPQSKEPAPRPVA